MATISRNNLHKGLLNKPFISIPQNHKKSNKISNECKIKHNLSLV